MKQIKFTANAVCEKCKQKSFVGDLDSADNFPDNFLQ